MFDFSFLKKKVSGEQLLAEKFLDHLFLAQEIGANNERVINLKYTKSLIEIYDQLIGVEPPCDTNLRKMQIKFFSVSMNIIGLPDKERIVSSAIGSILSTYIKFEHPHGDAVIEKYEKLGNLMDALLTEVGLR